MEKVEKEVYTNKELRETLESLNLNYNEIDSVDLEIGFKSYSTYEEDVSIENLVYKGYNFYLHGGIAEEISDPELYHDNLNLQDVIDLIGDYEIEKLEFNLEYSIGGIGNRKDFFVQKIVWEDKTPDNIKKEFEEEYKESKYKEIIVSNQDKFVFSEGYSSFFKNENNLSFFKISFDIYSITWLNNE